MSLIGTASVLRSLSQPSPPNILPGKAALGGSFTVSTGCSYGFKGNQPQKTRVQHGFPYV